MHPIRHLIPLAVIAASLVATTAQAATDASVRQAGAIAYVSGGVSEEGRESLSAIAKDFNLKLILATKSGAYLSDVAIVVSDDRGQRVLETKSEGPWFYAKLPAGRYAIEATANWTVVRKAVTVGPQPSRVDFRWDD